VLSTHAQSVLLLTAYLTKRAGGDPRPLSPSEWGRFARWLAERSLDPAQLITGNPRDLLGDWTDRSISLDRIEFLLGRSSALALSAEKWQRLGLWVATRSDADYPARLKDRLKADSPAALFGCGDRKLLNRGGIAVVGSRDAGPRDLEFADTLGRQAAREGVVLISGGARGVDQAAMLAAIEAEGSALGVLSDGLLRGSTSARYRRGLLEGRLALVSPFHPEAAFDVGNAMARNKYVYCIADAAIVVVSTENKGGTWSGAVENLRRSWVPLWVREDTRPGSGNAALARQGAQSLPEPLQMLSSLTGRDAFRPGTLFRDEESPGET
jgi:predicted Rossmann fold nucleotide-binding protein DprA/Smf involved in DNA uptake